MFTGLVVVASRHVLSSLSPNFQLIITLSAAHLVSSLRLRLGMKLGTLFVIMSPSKYSR